jgi:hypothetical protein
MCASFGLLCGRIHRIAWRGRWSSKNGTKKVSSETSGLRRVGSLSRVRVDVWWHVTSCSVERHRSGARGWEIDRYRHSCTQIPYLSRDEVIITCEITMAIETLPLPLPPTADSSKFKDFGREVRGVHPGRLTDEEFKEIEQLLYKVCVIPPVSQSLPCLSS